MELTSDFTGIEKSLLTNAAKKRIPISGSIELLPLCNLNCDMCYVHLTKQEMERKGRLLSADEWLDTARQMKDAGVLFMLLTGGEPLLYPEFKKLYCGLKELGMIVTINTNGTMINEEWADFFSEYQPRRINITVYGSNNATYEKLCHYASGFDRVMNGIRLLLDRGVSVRINESAVPMNEDELVEILKMGHELGIPGIVDTYMLPATRERDHGFAYDARLTPGKAAKLSIDTLRVSMGEENFSRFCVRKLWEVEHILPAEGPKRMSCYAGKASFAINWQGNMCPCVIMGEPAISVYEYGFQSAWDYIVAETEKITLSDRCNSCKLRPVCRNCAACALLEGGSYDSVPAYMCIYAEETKRQLELYFENYIK